MILKHQSSKAWATICDVGAFAPGGPQRTILVPPRDAAGFEQLLGTLNFTNGSDKEMVLALYQATLHTALGQTRSLRYTGLRWGDTEMAGLVKVLPLCSKLKYLNLKGSHNAYTDASADALADLLSHEGVLPQLHMIGAGCREKGAQEPDPLLENARLRGACESRGIELLSPRAALRLDKGAALGGSYSRSYSGDANEEETRHRVQLRRLQARHEEEKQRLRLQMEAQYAAQRHRSAGPWA